MTIKYSSLGWKILSCAVALSTLTIGSAANAAEAVVFKYGLISRAIPVQELTEFVKTGKSSSDLRSYLKLAKQRPEAVRALLSREIPIPVTTLDRFLNSPIGNVELDRLGRTFQTPPDTANRQALRGALIVSASRDNRVSLIEVLQNYPTRELQIDARELRNSSAQLSQLTQGLLRLPR